MLKKSPNVDNIPYEKLQFAKQYIKNRGNASEAVRIAKPYLSKSSIGNAATRLSNDPQVKAVIAQVLEGEGLSDLKTAKELKKILKATRPLIIEKRLEKFPDYAVRLEGIKTIEKLKGNLNSGINISTDNRQVNMVFQAPEDVKALASVVKEMRLLKESSTVEGGGQSGEVIDVESYRVD